MEPDLSLCYDTLLSDMPTARDFAELRGLALRFNVKCLPDATLRGAQWNGEAITYSSRLSIFDLMESIPHEVVHALADGERYSYLNHEIEGWHYDREAFIERLAQRVGAQYRLFYTNECP